jgi:DNA-binding PadR family transcriptional regulator
MLAQVDRPVPLGRTTLGTVDYVSSAVNRHGDMTPQMMVLGVVAREPGTVANTQRRLTETFPTAALERNTAHVTLPRLAKKGWVRLVKRGDEESEDVYEVTDVGREERHKWVIRTPRPPAQRDAIHGKVQFADFEELQAVIRYLEKEENAAREAGDEAHRQMQGEKRLLQRFPPKGWREEMHAETRMLHLKDVTAMWADAADRRRLLREQLEETKERFANKAAHDDA